MAIVNWWKYCNIFILCLNLVKGLEFLVEPQNAVSLQSEPFWWHCQAATTSNLVVYKWRFGDADAPTSNNQVVYRNGTLHIKEAKTTSVGEYQCIITSGAEIKSSQKVTFNLAKLSPSFSKNPKSVTVNVKQPVTLECEIDSYPAAQITWYLGDNPLSKGFMVSRTLSTFKIDSVSYKDEGSYSCLANNTMLNQNLRSSTAVLTVQGQPEILKSPVSARVPLGTAVLFDCEAAGRPSPSVTWYFTKTGSSAEVQIQAQTEYTINTNNSLSIAFATDDLGGTYKCVAKNSEGEDSKTATLTLTGPATAPVFSSTSGDQLVVEGDNVVFQCIVSGNPPPVITWSKETGDLPTDRVSYPDANKMILSNVKGSDRGTYICKAENTQGIITKSSKLTVQVRPSFTATPLSKTVVEGEKATLACRAVGEPQPTLSWKTPVKEAIKPGEEDSGVKVAADGTLTIDLPDVKHHGLYICTATNTVGSQSVSAQLNVQGPPVFVQTPVSQMAKAGDANVTIPCRTLGYPKPTISWYRFAAKDKITTSSKYEITAEGDLVIKNVVIEDKGQYVCAASNGYDKTKEGSLNVIVTPSFTVQPTDQKTKVGDTVVLHCQTTGDPVPVQNWHKDQRKLVLASNMQLIPTNQTLIISDIKESQLGNYACVASNQGGDISATATVYIIAAPIFSKPPTNSSVALGKDVTVTCRAISETQPTMTWYRSDESGNKTSIIAKSDNERVYSTADGDLNIKLSDNGDEGWYICVAGNTLGETASSPIFINILVGPSITSTNSPQMASEKASATLSCEADGDPTPELTWHSPRYVTITKTSPGYTQSGSNLTIDSVAAKTDGGNWKCRACNTISCDDGVVELLIEGPPFINDVITSRDSVAIKIECKAIGLPVPTLTYYVGSQAKIDDTPGHIIEGNQLLVNPVDAKNSYTCKASNDYGFDSKYLTKPGRPTSPQIIKIEAREVTLTWTDGPLSDLPVVKYNLEERVGTAVDWKPSNMTSTDQDYVYKAINLLPYTSYIFRVSITNVLATGEISEESVRLGTLADAPSEPTNITVEDLVGKIRVRFNHSENYNGNKDDVQYEVELKYRTPGTVEYISKQTIFRSANQELLVEFENVTNGDYIVGVKSKNTKINAESRTVEFSLTVSDKAPTFIPVISSAVATAHDTIEVIWNGTTCNTSCVPPVIGFTIIVVDESGTNRTNTTMYQEGVESQIFYMTNLEQYTKYTVYLVAYNDVGLGSKSEPKNVTTLYAPFSALAYTEPLGVEGWVIALVAGIIGLLLLILILGIICYHHRQYKKQTASSSSPSRFYLGQPKYLKGQSDFNFLPRDSASYNGSTVLWRRIFCLPITGEYDLEPMNFSGYSSSTISKKHHLSPNSTHSHSRSHLVNNDYIQHKNNPLFQDDSFTPYTEQLPVSSIPPPKPKRKSQPQSQEPILSPLNQRNTALSGPSSDRRSSSSLRQLIPDSPVDRNPVYKHDHDYSVDNTSDYPDSFSHQNGSYNFPSSFPSDFNRTSSRDSKSQKDVSLTELEVLSQLFSDIEAEEDNMTNNSRFNDRPDVFYY